MNADAILLPIAFRNLRFGAALLIVTSLAACDETGAFNLNDVFAPQPDGETEIAATDETQGEFIERDVEAPEVFSANEAGLWDGRPSLGGVWVAHPDVQNPERVMIRNTENGKFVVGALFRRERLAPGPQLQLSSDAANELGVLAGAPVQLSVVVLRKERIEVTPPEPEAPAEPDAPQEADSSIPEVTESDGEAPTEIQETELDPIAAAGAAIEAADPTPAVPAAPAVTAAASAGADATVQSTLPETTLEKPFVQVGIFNVERNAKTVADQMRSAGMVPTVKTGESDGKEFWRVVVGPVSTQADQEILLKKIKDQGYSDAYTVTN